MPMDTTAAGREGDAASPAASPASFEQAMAELEGLVQGMEGGDFSLEQSLAAYRRGAALVSFCRQSLAQARQQVKILEGDLLKAFEDAPGDVD